MGKNSNQEKTATRLKNKSIEALLLGIEVYNKPTIKYRTEASAFLICNAWELLLKSHRIITYGEESIYRKSDNKSYSLEEMCNLTFDNNSPIKKNLDYIVKEIRNTATHFILKEHDNLYSPLLQKAVLNYVDFLKEKFSYDLTSKISTESFALFIRHDQTNKNLSKIYGANFAKNFFNDKNQLVNFIKENTTEDNGCSVVSIIENRLSFVKNPNKADIRAYYEKGTTPLTKVYVSTSDVNNSHPHTMGQIIRELKACFNNTHYNLDKLNAHNLNRYNKDNKISENDKFYKELFYGEQKYKKYSDAYLDSLIAAITKNQDLFSSKKEHPSSE